jgi:N-formylglutamate amidohydrolase
MALFRVNNSLSDNETGFFEILAPSQWTLPVVFNSPHSGKILPPDLVKLSRLSLEELHASEDHHVDTLFMGCIEYGAPMLRALVSRSYVDLNREPFEFDSRMFDERLPAYMNATSPRVASGLGTIPRTVGDGLNIYPGPISLADALHRVETIYRPYHRTLAALLDEAHRAAGTVLLMDCHSMPSSAVPSRGSGNSCDVVLGDRFGSACGAEFMQLVEEHFREHGLRPVRNRPYAGGYFTESHGRPREDRHALQIELNRALYMNERTRQPNRDFQSLRTCLDGLSRKLIGCFAELAPRALAAE